MTVDDLDELPISDRVKEIIRNGKVEGETKDKDNTRSAWRFEGVCGLLRAGVAPEAVVGILIDAQYEISSRVLELDEGAEQYARNEVERVRMRDHQHAPRPMSLTKTSTNRLIRTPATTKTKRGRRAR